jgi:phospholipid/cholesterol/gamma-HCH transport system substrate-binding protein
MAESSTPTPAPPLRTTLRWFVEDSRAWLRNHVIASVAMATALLLVAALGWIFVVDRGGPTRSYTAEFTATPGLYPSNAVDILGVPTGTITRIAAGQDAVRVTMRLPAHVKVPANATAVLMAPNPVSDRFVELYPPYTGGPVLSDGAVIPVERTVVPLELDQIFSNLNDLATSLGPNGANSDGAVSAVLASLAHLAAGNGTNLHTTLVSLAKLLPALTADPTRVSQLIDNLDELSSTLAAHDSTIGRLYSDLAGATSELAAERDTLGAALGNLQQGLTQLAQFLRSNKAAIGATTAQLATSVSAVVKEQQDLIDTFDTAALGFQNFANAINLEAPCDTGHGTCPALSVRVEVPATVHAIVDNYCGTTAQNAVPILANSAGVGSATTVNTLCVFEMSAVQGNLPPPGAPNTPDLGLDRFLR